MSNINTLVPDIQELLRSKEKGWFNEQLSQELSLDLASRLSQQFGQGERKPTLRLSAMGPRCPKALWYSIRHPELAEALPPWAEFKYAFGHIIEALAITLAKAAGHDVVGEQDELTLDGIVGHRDCVIDGVVVDVKSSSTRGFQKFKSPQFALADSFGYLDQLDGYVLASRNDPLVTDKEHGYILAIDKTLGHMVIYQHEVTEERERTLRDRIQLYKDVVKCSNPPACGCKTIPQGASGNIQLDIKASYSPFKHCCFPLLRTFFYANGPVYLTKVVRIPDVPELTGPIRTKAGPRIQVREEELFLPNSFQAGTTQASQSRMAESHA